MNILDLFSGIGGFSLAVQRAGFKIEKHYASEIDKYAQMIYRRNFDGSIQLGDITGIGDDLGKIDIITGGFPCQAFSIAGKRRGFEDTRGTLFFEIERLCRFYKPSYMVLENVKGLASHEGGDTIRVILDKLRGLDYSVQLLLLNTKDFGIPQNRERFFFICTARGKRQPEISGIRERKTEIAFSANCIDANYYKGIDNHGQRTCVLTPANNRQTFKNKLSEIVPCIYPGAQSKNSDNNPLIVKAVCTPEIAVKNQNGRLIKDNEEPMFTLSVRDRHGVMIQPKEIDVITDPIREKYDKKYLLSDSGFSRKREFRNTAPPLRAHDGCGHDNYTVIDTKNCFGKPKYFNNISPTITANHYKEQLKISNDSIIRRLTPIECERLQDYPDNWTKYGIEETGKEVKISDTQRYKTCGNSITVKVAAEIMKEIRKVY